MDPVTKYSGISRHPVTEDASTSSQNGVTSARRDDFKSQPQTNKSSMKILDTTQLVRVQLIHENWTFIESKKSPLFSTSSRYSVLSLVPPSSSSSTARPTSLGPPSPIGGDGHETIGDGRWETPKREIGVEAARRPVDNKYGYQKTTSGKPWNFENDDTPTYRTSPRRPRAVDDVLDEYRRRALSRYHTGNGATLAKKKTGGIERGKKYDDGYEEDDELDTSAAGSGLADDEQLHRRTNGSSRNNGHVHVNGGSQNNGFADNYLEDNGLHEPDVCNDDEDFDADVLTSVARRKQRHIQLPDYHDTTPEDLRLFGDPRTISGKILDVDVDALCVTPRGDVDDDDDDNVTFLPRWVGSRDRDVTKQTIVPSYENLVSLQRDASRPLLMYVPEPVDHGKPSVGDVDVSELSDLSDPDTPSSDDDRTIKPIERMDSCVQTEIPSPLPVELPAFSVVPASSASSKTSRDGGTQSQQQQQQPQQDEEETVCVFTRKPANVTLSEGEVAEVSCQLEGPEPYDVYWFRDTADLVNLDDDDRCEYHRHGNTFGVKLYNATRRDSGYYLCVAVNGQGQSTYRFLVVVTASVHVEKRRAPNFTRRLQTNVTIVSGQTNELDCHVTGYPEPQVTWFLDGRKIKDGGEFTVGQSSSGDHHLIIHSAGSQQCRTAQQILVVARNVVAEITASSKIDIQPLVINGPIDSDSTTTPVIDVANQVASPNDDSSLYPDSDQLMKIAEQAANNRAQGKEPAQPARQHSLLTGFTRSLDLGDPLIASVHGEPVVRQPPVSPRVTYQDNSPRHDRNEGDDLDLVDLELTFPQFNVLFAAGIISNTEMNMGRVKRSDLTEINEFLSRSQPEIVRQEVPSSEQQEVTLTIDCGLKRVDSKRYRRDYIINREPGDRGHGAAVPHSTTRSMSLDHEILGKRTSRFDRMSSHHHSDEREESTTNDFTDLPTEDDNSFDVNRNGVVDGEQWSRDQVAPPTAAVNGNEEEPRDSEIPQEKGGHEQSRDQARAGEDDHVTLLSIDGSHDVKENHLEVSVAEDNHGTEPYAEGRRGSESRDARDVEEKVAPIEDKGDHHHNGSLDNDKEIGIEPYAEGRRDIESRDDRDVEEKVATVEDNGDRHHNEKVAPVEDKGDHHHNGSLDNDEEIVPLPSVREMLAKFNEQTNFTRVHSLTGRELPLSLREKTKPIPKPTLTPPTSAVQSHPRDRIQSESATRSYHGNPTGKHLNIGAALERSQSTSNAVKPATPVTPATPATPSTTLARMMFWQQRISSGQTTDCGDVIDSFPQLPNDLFKQTM